MSGPRCSPGLLERAVAACRHQGGRRGDVTSRTYTYLIPILEQRVDGAIDDLRSAQRGPDDAGRPQADVEGLAARLQALQRVRAGPLGA